MAIHHDKIPFSSIFHELALCQARGAPWSTMEHPGWRLWRQVGPEACFARLMWPSCRSWGVGTRNEGCVVMGRLGSFDHGMFAELSASMMCFAAAWARDQFGHI